MSDKDRRYEVERAIRRAKCSTGRWTPSTSTTRTASAMSQGDAGSSVPEAARAADPLSELADFVARLPLMTLPDGREFVRMSVVLDTINAWPRIPSVAAAVAEERATTGRRIEALAAEWRRDAAQPGSEHFRHGYQCAREDCADAVRAALASPGGRWVHVTRGDECAEQPTPSQVIGDFRPTTTSGEPWWCTTHQDHLRWVASPGEGE